MKFLRKEIKSASCWEARSCVTKKPNSQEKEDSLWNWAWRQWPCLNDPEEKLTSQWAGGVQPGLLHASQPPAVAGMTTLPLTSAPLQAPALSCPLPTCPPLGLCPASSQKARKLVLIFAKACLDWPRQSLSFDVGSVFVLWMILSFCNQINHFD